MPHVPAARIRLLIPSPNFRFLGPESQTRFATFPQRKWPPAYTCQAQSRDRPAPESPPLGAYPQNQGQKKRIAICRQGSSKDENAYTSASFLCKEPAEGQAGVERGLKFSPHTTS